MVLGGLAADVDLGACCEPRAAADVVAQALDQRAPPRPTPRARVGVASIRTLRPSSDATGPDDRCDLAVVSELGRESDTAAAFARSSSVAGVEGRRRSRPGRRRRPSARRRARRRRVTRGRRGTGSSAPLPVFSRERRDRQGQQHGGDEDHRDHRTRHHPCRPALPEGRPVADPSEPGRRRRRKIQRTRRSPTRRRPPASTRWPRMRISAGSSSGRGQDRDRDDDHRAERHRAQRLVVDHPEARPGR